jgi:hypothetical protein
MDFLSKLIMEKSIKQMLCDQFGWNPDYVVNRIKTIFYNGKPVDDMETAIVHDGSYAGTFRCNAGSWWERLSEAEGYCLHSGPAYLIDPMTAKLADSGEGAVYIKLFNLLVPEIGPGFLKRGIFVQKPSWILS